jgi:hypothetical protein
MAYSFALKKRAERALTLGDDCAGSRRTASVVTWYAVLVDLFNVGRLLRPGKIVFLDDYHVPVSRVRPRSS